MIENGPSGVRSFRQFLEPERPFLQPISTKLGKKHLQGNISKTVWKKSGKTWKTESRKPSDLLPCAIDLKVLAF